MPFRQKFFKIVVEHSATILFLGVIALSMFGFLGFNEEVFVQYLEMHPTNAFVVVTVGIAFATVIAPVALLPLIPLIAPMLGPFLTGLACWLGWTIGAVIAFCIARYGGRPLLMRFVTAKSLHRYESRIPKDTHFLVILAMRMVIPVDLLSYAFGFFSTVNILVYTAASSLSFLWFSFAFAYLGYAFNTSNTVLFVGSSVASAIIFAGAFWYTFRTMKRQKRSSK